MKPYLRKLSRPLGIFLLCSLPLLFVGPVVFQVLWGQFFLQQQETTLRKPEVYKPVAQTLALYCQSDPHFFSKYLDAAWFPAQVRMLGNGFGRGSVHPDEAWLEFGGGFHHFGYRLARSQQPAPQAMNRWELFFYSEDRPDVLLETLTLPAKQRLSSEELLARVLPGYDAQIAAKASDPEQCEGVFQNKIQLLLRFDKVTDARKTCQTMLTTLPDYWWGYLINALILTQTQSAAQGEQFLRRWVERQPNFFSYLDLAYYYQLEQQPQRAAEAMIAATAYDANVDWGHDGNAEYRGYTAAMYALKSGQYPAAIRLCDKLLTVTVNRGYAKSALQALREAATRRAAGQPAALRWDEDMERFDPFRKIDLEKLLQRPRKHSPKQGSPR